MSHGIYRSFVLALGLALVGCNRPSVDLSALQEEIAELKAQFDQERKTAGKLRSELESFTALKDNISTTLSDLSRQQKEAMAGMDEIKEQFMAYRDDYKSNIRGRAAGMSMPDFEALGRLFKNVVVKSVDDWEIAFKHANGMTRLNFTDAPPEVRILFAYNPNVGPKPPKPIAPTSTLTPEEDLTLVTSVISEPSNSTPAPAGDPFANSKPPPSVGSALRMDPALAGKDTPTFRKPIRPARRVVFKDGSACEILAEF